MYPRLASLAIENRTVLCFGIDPMLNKMKGDENAGVDARITNYYFEITDALLDSNSISAIKPNHAYFAQYGFEGLKALKAIIDRYRNKTYIILDAKRGDIGRSSDAYAKEAFDFYAADAITVSPYMGSDSVKPFLREGKTVYALCRTSNEGASDFQELSVARKPLYEQVAKKASEWGCGLVVGATSDAIRKISKIARESGNQVPFLIPGVGTQGGDLELVLKAIKPDLAIHRINASSSIAFAHEKKGGSPVQAALAEANGLNQTIRKYLK
jgi:orotidine-5'-phosphate decarboxylase